MAASPAFRSSIYYGEVNEDSDGPAEACVPIAEHRGGASDADRRVGSLNLPDSALPDSIGTHAMRLEAAHREAYLRLRKAQVAFPQILSAYDGVARWAAANGIEITGAPREIYFADFRSAGPGDEVCDVAFPVR